MSASWAVLLRVLLPFAGGYFLSYLYRTVNAVIAPDLTAALALDASDLGLLTSAYFLAFALFQLPLGMLLDRFGPRRVEAVLLLFAGLGALLFAVSTERRGLIVGRALIGLGVSACLMASFKALVMWFPLQRLPAVNGWIMAAGGLGALTATAPVEALLHWTDWRGIFWGLSAATFAMAGAIYWIVPERAGAPAGGALAAQWQGLVAIFQSRIFWRIAPLATLSQGSFLAIQSLWSGPWLLDVAALPRATVANYLLLLAAAMVAGYLLIGALAYRLGRLGAPPLAVAAGGMMLFMLTQAGLVLGAVDVALPLWMLFGFFGTSGILCYAALSQLFPPELAGRVNTALNLLVFSTAFVGQWGIGAIIDYWPAAGGGYELAGYSAAFGTALGLQVLALGWFWISGRGVVNPARWPASDSGR